MELVKHDLKIDFLGKRTFATMFSVLLIASGVISIAIHGGLRYGIDFAGGTLVQLKFKNPPVIDDIRKALKTLQLEDSMIQEFGSEKDILIRVERSQEKLQAVGENIRKGIVRIMKTEEITLERVEMVGPKVGKDLREKALLAILYATIGIVMYISWRFEFKYALAAIIALIHDVLITLGVFSVLDKEFTLVVVAAILTIIGYSLNDTIVVFDRIRENLRRKGKECLETIVNMSVNQTLSRTLLTSGTTILMVVALLFFGGEIIHDFALALTVGILAGTYSSIFIASVFLVLWEERSS